jgi:exosortase/archaeosortase family protein
MGQILKKKIFIWLLFSINLLFAFIIGFTIPLLESKSRLNFGLIMIPLLIILNYVFLERFHYTAEEREKLNEWDENQRNKNKIPIIEYKGKKYSFSTRSLIFFPIGIILLAALMILFFEMRINYWLHELVAKNSVFFLNLFFNIGAEAMYLPEFPYPWHISIPDSIGVYITSGCTGTPAISILSAIVICTPSSQDPMTKKDISWRKTVDIIATVTSIYLFNILRMVIVIYLYHLGFAWDVIHDSLANLSAVIVAHIFIFWFCNKLIPEWYISIYYSGKLLFNKFKGSLDLKKKKG